MLFILALAAIASKRREEDIFKRYMERSINGSHLVNALKQSGAVGAHITGQKEGYLSISVRDKAGNEISSYETRDAQEQLELLNLRRPLSKAGIHTRRVRNPEYLERKVRDKLRYS
jgi:hypothetical protein